MTKWYKNTLSKRQQSQSTRTVLTDHCCNETRQPQPLSVAWKQQATWKNAECNEFKDNSKCHQRLNSDEPCYKHTATDTVCHQSVCGPQTTLQAHSNRHSMSLVCVWSLNHATSTQQQTQYVISLCVVLKPCYKHTATDIVCHQSVCVVLKPRYKHTATDTVCHQSVCVVLKPRYKHTATDTVCHQSVCVVLKPLQESNRHSMSSVCVWSSNHATSTQQQTQYVISLCVVPKPCYKQRATDTVCHQSVCGP